MVKALISFIVALSAVLSPAASLPAWQSAGITVTAHDDTCACCDAGAAGAAISCAAFCHAALLGVSETLLRVANCQPASIAAQNSLTGVAPAPALPPPRAWAA